MKSAWNCWPAANSSDHGGARMTTPVAVDHGLPRMTTAAAPGGSQPVEVCSPTGTGFSASKNNKWNPHGGRST